MAVPAAATKAMAVRRKGARSSGRLKAAVTTKGRPSGTRNAPMTSRLLRTPWYSSRPAFAERADTTLGWSGSPGSLNRPSMSRLRASRTPSPRRRTMATWDTPLTSRPRPRDSVSGSRDTTPTPTSLPQKSRTGRLTWRPQRSPEASASGRLTTTPVARPSRCARTCSWSPMEAPTAPGAVPHITRPSRSVTLTWWMPKRPPAARPRIWDWMAWAPGASSASRRPCRSCSRSCTPWMASKLRSSVCSAMAATASARP